MRELSGDAMYISNAVRKAYYTMKIAVKVNRGYDGKSIK